MATVGNSGVLWALLASSVVVAITAWIALDLYKKGHQNSPWELAGIYILLSVAGLTFLYCIISLILFRRRRGLSLFPTFGVAAAAVPVKTPDALSNEELLAYYQAQQNNPTV